MQLWLGLWFASGNYALVLVDRWAEGGAVRPAAVGVLGSLAFGVHVLVSFAVVT
jgi:hypothetical protein